jgi:VNT family MFS transporter (synaptic vesicle glycoprotein 2)
MSLMNRSTAMAITLAAARLGAILGNIIFGVFVDVICAVPILLVAALLIGNDLNYILKDLKNYLSFSGGGLLSLLLPNTTKEPLT